MHVACSAARTISVSELLEEIEKRSSKWIKAQGCRLDEFSRQNGYGAFSIGQSQPASLKRYIARQREHHGRGRNSANSWIGTRSNTTSGTRGIDAGRPIAYMLKHGEKLTLFLRQPGTPLDNNICERALKKAILHRKNALYKTANGARVGDVFISLIYTCELCGAAPRHRHPFAPPLAHRITSSFGNERIRAEAAAGLLPLESWSWAR